MTHAFDEALHLQHRDGLAVATTHPAYANMVGPFGGMTAATVLQAILEHPDVAGEPVALTVNFAAPIADGEWTLRAIPARTNRTNQHWTVLGEQGGHVVVTATAVLSIITEGWSDQQVPVPEIPAFEDLPAVTQPWPLAWLNNYEMRFATGGIDAYPSESSRTVLRLRQTDARPWDTTAIAAAADAIFPRVFLRTGPMTPAGTVSMTTYFHATSADLATTGAELVIDTDANRYARGYYDQHASLFDDAGHLIATTHQTVYFKPRG